VVHGSSTRLTWTAAQLNPTISGPMRSVIRKALKGKSFLGVLNLNIVVFILCCQTLVYKGKFLVVPCGVPILKPSPKSMKRWGFQRRAPVVQPAGTKVALRFCLLQGLSKTGCLRLQGRSWASPRP
jgi:hypothetical protein